jgi:NADPH-dependent curcumin reductase CurA
VATGSVDALLAEGHAAFEQGDAESSRHAFEAALAEGESGELLEGLAPDALNRLFTGQNLDKQLVRIADESFD